MGNLPTEHQEQAALFKIAALHCGQYPELDLMYANPNGGARNKITGAMLKAEGVKPGVPDIFLPVPRANFHGLYVEMKRRKGGKLSQAQINILNRLNEQGYACLVAPGWELAWQGIKDYLELTTKQR